MFAGNRRQLPDNCLTDRQRCCRRLAKANENVAVRCLFGRPNPAEIAADLIRIEEQLLTARSLRWNFDFDATSSAAARPLVDDVTGDTADRGCCRPMTPESASSSLRYEWTLFGMNREPGALNDACNADLETAKYLPSSTTDENIYGDGNNFDAFQRRRRRRQQHRLHHQSGSSPLTTSSNANCSRCSSRSCNDCLISSSPPPLEGARVSTTDCASSLSRNYRQLSTNRWRKIADEGSDRRSTHAVSEGPTAGLIIARDSVKRKRTIPDFFPCKKSPTVLNSVELYATAIKNTSLPV